MSFWISGWGTQGRCRYSAVSLITRFDFMAPVTPVMTALQCTYLLNNEQRPFCISCNEPFTVIKHFLIICIESHHIRTKYFKSSADKIISFLKETNLISKL